MWTNWHFATVCLIRKSLPISAGGDDILASSQKENEVRKCK